MAEILNRYGTRSASRCDKNPLKNAKCMKRPNIQNITKGLITEKIATPYWRPFFKWKMIVAA